MEMRKRGNGPAVPILHTKLNLNCVQYREGEEEEMMVEVIESTFVVPSEATPTGKLRLSNLEQVAPRLYACQIYFYKNNKARDFFSIDVMKAALAKALVLFYPLAGRHVVGDDSLRTVDCSSEGALLVVARSERSSDEISFEPSPELRSQFVPSTTESLSLMIMLQITYLKCGGVVLGSANNHIYDGRSVFHFFQTWAQIARGEIHRIVPPSFDNTRLLARSPPTVTFDHQEYGSADQLVTNTSTPPSHFTTKIKLSNDQISSLKSRCFEGTNDAKVSTFCAISAFFWKCYCIAQELTPDTETKLYFSSDIRTRLQPPLPQSFFGNAIIRTSATAKVSEITSNSINVAAEAVKSGIDRITDEYVRSFIDYVELNLHKKLTMVNKNPKSVLRIANITGMPVYEADFGWGAPYLLTWAQASGTNLVNIVNEPENGGVAAYVVLDSESTMHKFKECCYKELSLVHSRL